MLPASGFETVACSQLSQSGTNMSLLAISSSSSSNLGVALDTRWRQEQSGCGSRNCLTLRAQLAGKALSNSRTAQAGSAAAEIVSSAGPAGCPFTQLTTRLAGQSSPSPETAPAAPDGFPIPGPHPFSLDSLMDVSRIFFHGLHEAMLYFSLKYGPICRFANPASLNNATSWVFLNSPDFIQHVCATNVRNYGMRYLPDIYKYVTHEKGILGSQGDYNAKHRRLCQPPFRSRLQLQKFAQVVVARSVELADIWQQNGGAGFCTDMATQTQRLTLDVVGLVAFNHDFKQTERIQRDMSGAANDHREGTDRLLWAVNTFGEVLAEVFITPLPVLKFLGQIGFPQLRMLEESVKTMRESMLEVIQGRREALAAGADHDDSLLGVLLQTVDEDGRPMTDEELWEDVHDVMGAGHETTATTTAAALYCISAHPEVERKVAAELDTVLGGRPPAYEDLERLPYLTQCVKETMRLYPAIPVFPREAKEDDVLPSGHPIKSGDVVFMSSYAIGRCPRIWADPLTFDPDRFSPTAKAQHHKFQWLPFGAGPRMCLGASFAQMSVTLMAATLLQRFRFKPLQPTSQLIPVQYDITMNFNGSKGLKMGVQPRFSASEGR